MAGGRGRWVARPWRAARGVCGRGAGGAGGEGGLTANGQLVNLGEEMATLSNFFVCSPGRPPARTCKGTQGRVRARTSGCTHPRAACQHARTCACPPHRGGMGGRRDVVCPRLGVLSSRCHAGITYFLGRNCWISLPLPAPLSSLHWLRRSFCFSMYVAMAATHSLVCRGYGGGGAEREGGNVRAFNRPCTEQ